MSPRGAASAALLLAAVLALASLGCARPRSPAGTPFRPGLWPVYSADAYEWAGVRERRALGPFVHWEQAGRETRFEARPFASTRSAPELDRLDLLYPFAARRVTPDRSQSRLFWLVRTRSEPDRERTEQAFGPVFWGQTDEGQSYRGVFPIRGQFLKRFGFDRVRFSLWPLFARGERGGYTETQILWPFFAIGSGDGDFKLRIWPFYGVKRREGRYESRFWLWPFFHYKRDHLDSAEPETAFYALPLYGRKDRGPLHSRFYLFPLSVRQWSDRNPDLWRRDWLWPIYSRGRAGDRSLLAIRPLWMQRRSPQERTWSLMFGLAGREQHRTDTLERSWTRVLWLGRFGQDREAGRVVARREIWPLFRRADFRDPDGREHGFVRVPWLLPTKGLEPDGWDRHWNKLFEVYGSRYLNDEQRSSTLFGLRESRSEPGSHWTLWGGWLAFHSRDDATPARRAGETRPPS